MKRKRDLLYDVFGRRTMGSSDAAEGSRTRPSRSSAARREVRLSFELLAALAVAMLVLVGTSYYLGRLGGRSAAERAELSTKDQSGRPASSTKAAASGSSVKPFWAVRCLTAKWGARTSRKQCEDYVRRICSYLEKQGYKEILPLIDPEASEIYVYVGRDTQPDDLEGLEKSLRELEYQKEKPFSAAYITKVDVEFN